VADANLVNAIPFGTNPSESFTFSVSDGFDTVSTSYTVDLSGAVDGPLMAGATINLNEKSPNGFLVYDVNLLGGQSDDVDGDNRQVTYTITSGNTDEVFQIDPSSGKITLLDSTKLNTKIIPSYDLMITATEQTGSLLSTSAIITIKIVSGDTVTMLSRKNILNDGVGPKKEVPALPYEKTEDVEIEKIPDEDEDLSVAVRSNYIKATLANTQLGNSSKPLKVASPEAPTQEPIVKERLAPQTQKLDGLENYRGLRNVLSPPDTLTDSKGRVTYKLPEGTFVGGKGAISLTATQRDGSPLPEWIKFDSVTGKVVANVPKDIKAPLEIKIEATDKRGDKAETSFKILPAPDKISLMGKKSLSSQFKSAFDLVA
jgi:hypothetical protein